MGVNINPWPESDGYVIAEESERRLNENTTKKANPEVWGGGEE